MQDLIILNARIRTMDFDCPFAEAVAISDGIIQAVGTSDDIRTLATPETQIINADNRTVLPGLIDSHVHLFQGAAELDFLPVGNVANLDELRTNVKAYASDRPDEPLILGVGAFYELMADTELSPRAALDAILADRPFAVLAADLHTVWANSLALERAGLLQGAKMPEGSTVVMGDDGLATGLLLETGAFGPVLGLSRTGGRDMVGYVTGNDPVPPATLEQREADKALLLKGIDHALSNGVTTLHNMDGNFYQLDLLAELERENRLNMRVQVPFHFKNFDPLDRLSEASHMHARYHSDRVWSGRVKMFMDGVLESRTALKMDAYPDDPENHGDQVFDTEHFNEACRIADAAGLQICVHAIGDLAVKRVLDGYAYARAQNGTRDARHRIEHVELIAEDDIARMKDLGVVASMQPRHAAFGGFFAPPKPETIFFEGECARAYAWRRLRDAGIRVTFSTDWPVVPIDPLANMQSALVPLELGPAWPDQRQTLDETLASYTSDNAWLCFREEDLGRIRPGQKADVVILSDDIEATSDLSGLHVDMTLSAGCVVYSRSSAKVDV